MGLLELLATYPFKRMLKPAAGFGLLAMVLAAPAWAQAPIFLAASSTTTVIATGRSEVLGPIQLVATPACGGNTDGQCVGTAGAINILYLGTPIENTPTMGITVTEVVGGVARTAPSLGRFISGIVSVSNTAEGGVVSIETVAGNDLSAGDQVIITGVRGQIASGPGSVPGTTLRARVRAPNTVAFFLEAEVPVAVSARGLEFVSAAPCPTCDPGFTMTFREGFNAAFAQFVATVTTPVPPNGRPAFGAVNNTQLRFTAANLNGRLTWPAKVTSQLVNGGGAAAGGSELQLVLQNFNGSIAIYQFATANQDLSDRTQETFAVTATVCGEGTFSVQAQLYPGANGRPGFNDPLIPSPPFSFSVRGLCRPAPLAVVSGDAQVVTVGSELPAPLVVRVQDKDGAAVAGATVNFAAVTSGGSVSPNSVVSDVQGFAQTRARVGAEPGIYFYSATVDSVTANFMATALASQMPLSATRIAVPHIASGGGFLTRLTLVNLGAQPNHVQVNFLSTSGALLRTVTETLAPNARFDLASTEADRLGELTIQWALIGTDGSLGVNFFFDVNLPGADRPLTAVSFSGSDLRQSFTVPFAFAQEASTGSVTQTAGIALANPSPRTNQITLELRDVRGVSRALDSLTLAPFAQTAFVPSDRPAFAAVLRSEQFFFGTITLAGGEPFSLLAVGKDFTQLFALPTLSSGGTCGAIPLGGRRTTIIPHFATGSGWGAQIAVTNLCPGQNTVRFEVFDQSGTRVASFLGPDTTLEPRATAVFLTSETQRFAEFNRRWARITSDVESGVHTLLDFKLSATQPATIAVGTSFGQPAQRFTLPFGFGPSLQRAQTVGLALANTSDTTADIVLRLVDRLGQVMAEDASLHLGPRAQVTLSILDVPAFRVPLASLTEFTGTVVIIASQPTSVLAVGRNFDPAFGIPPLAEISAQE